MHERAQIVCLNVLTVYSCLQTRQSIMWRWPTYRHKGCILYYDNHSHKQTSAEDNVFFFFTSSGVPRCSSPWVIVFINKDNFGVQQYWYSSIICFDIYILYHTYIIHHVWGGDFSLRVPAQKNRLSKTDPSPLFSQQWMTSMMISSVSPSRRYNIFSGCIGGCCCCCCCTKKSTPSPDKQFVLGGDPSDGSQKQKNMFFSFFAVFFFVFFCYHTLRACPGVSLLFCFFFVWFFFAATLVSSFFFFRVFLSCVCCVVYYVCIPRLLGTSTGHAFSRTSSARETCKALRYV